MKKYSRTATFFLSVLCLTFVVDHVFGQMTVKLITNPPVAEYKLTSGIVQPVSSNIEVSGADFGTYIVAIIVKRSDNTLFTHYQAQHSLVTGSNYIVGVDFDLTAGSIFNSTDTTGELYALMKSTATTGIEYKSNSIAVKLNKTASPPPTSGTTITNNHICCDQPCIPMGWYPQLLSQNSLFPLSGPIDQSKTVWEFVADGEETPGYIVNGNTYFCLPYQTNQTVRYRRLLNATFEEGQSAGNFWFGSIAQSTFDPIGGISNVVNGKPRPERYRSDHPSNWVTISVSTLRAKVGVAATTYTLSTNRTITARDIEIKGNQTNTTQSQVAFIAAESIRILPNTAISKGAQLKIDPSIANCSSARTAAPLDEPAQVLNEGDIKEQSLSAHPNPANEEAQITFNVKKRSSVKLSVADNNGHSVVTLLNGEILEPGNHSITFSTKGLTHGIYYYTLTVDGKPEIKRLMVAD